MKHKILLGAALAVMAALSLLGTPAHAQGPIVVTSSLQCQIYPLTCPQPPIVVVQPRVITQPAGGLPLTMFNPACDLTTEQMQQLTHKSVQKVQTEDCTWDRRTWPLIEDVTVPVGVIATITNPDGVSRVYVGQNQVVQGGAETFRLIRGFRKDDDVWEDPPCRLARKEFLNGRVDIKNFPVTTGNFTCPPLDDVSLLPNPSVQIASGCPLFGGVATSPLADGGCKLDQQPYAVNGTVPPGWWALSDKGRTESNQLLTTWVATLYLNGK